MFVWLSTGSIISPAAPIIAVEFTYYPTWISLFNCDKFWTKRLIPTKDMLYFLCIFQLDVQTWFIKNN